MSPVGELYCRELERLTRRWPSLGTSQVERVVALSLARAFVDLSATELAQAMAEDRPGRDERTDGRANDGRDRPRGPHGPGCRGSGTRLG